MILFLTFRTGARSVILPGDESDPVRIGLISPGEVIFFDPAFAVLSPIEMVLAPKASAFDFPVGSEHGSLACNALPFRSNHDPGGDLNGGDGREADLGDAVYAVSDGKVVYAGWSSDKWGNAVILLHELETGEMIESVYAHLDSVRVPVGGQVRRGGVLGTIGPVNTRDSVPFHFELRGSPGLDLGIGDGARDAAQARLNGETALVEWRGRGDDQLAVAPAGEPLEPSSLSLDVEEIGEKAP